MESQLSAICYESIILTIPLLGHITQTRPNATDVAHSMITCVSVCLLGKTVSHAKLEKPTEMLFGGADLCGPKKPYTR